MSVKVAQLPKRSTTDAEEIVRILDALQGFHDEGKLTKMVVVYFNTLGGFRVDMSSTLRASELALASAAVQRDLMTMMGLTDQVKFPGEPA